MIEIKSTGGDSPSQLKMQYGAVNMDEVFIKIAGRSGKQQ